MVMEPGELADTSGDTTTTGLIGSESDGGSLDGKCLRQLDILARHCLGLGRQFTQPDRQWACPCQSLLDSSSAYDGHFLWQQGHGHGPLWPVLLHFSSPPHLFEPQSWQGALMGACGVATGRVPAAAGAAAAAESVVAAVAAAVPAALAAALARGSGKCSKHAQLSPCSPLPRAHTFQGQSMHPR